MFSALLDTCVLVPSRARDVLLEAASAGVYRPLWSSEILAELDRTLRLLQARRGMAPEETNAYLVRLFRQMETSFPDALVTDWESLVDAVRLPDPGDRHEQAAPTSSSLTMSPISRPVRCPRRWSGSPWMSSCSAPLTFTPARSSARSTPSPGAGPQVPVEAAGCLVADLEQDSGHALAAAAAAAALSLSAAWFASMVSRRSSAMLGSVRPRAESSMTLFPFLSEWIFLTANSSWPSRSHRHRSLTAPFARMS